MNEQTEQTEQVGRIERIANKANVILDASKIDLFQLCHARYNYRTNLNKTLPLIKKATSLDKGTLAHGGLEVYFNEIAKGTHYNDRMQKSLMKIRELSCNPESSNSSEEEVDMILEAVEESCDFWRHEDEQLIVLAVEAPFDYVLFEDEVLRIVISGKIDLLVDVPQIGRSSGYVNLPFDHKTYTRDFPVYRLSNQFINYVAVTGSNYLIVNRIGLQKTLKPEEKFKRPPLSYDPEIIQQWKDNIVKMVITEYLQCVATDTWTMNFTSCYKFNRLCEYYEICDTSGEETKLWKLEANYVEAPKWDKYGKGSDT